MKQMLFQKRWFKWLGSLGLVLLLTAGGLHTAQAFEFDDDGFIGANEVISDDVILSGGQVTMEGTINGNLIAMGEDIEISGIVNGDVLAWGGRVTISGRVNGNVFAGAQLIAVSGPVQASLYAVGQLLKLEAPAEVEHNLMFAGLSFEQTAGAKIGRDVLTAGMQVWLAGEVGRDVTVSVDRLSLEGKVGRNVRAEVSAPSKDEAADSRLLDWIARVSEMPITFKPGGLRVSADAQIGGKLAYTSSVDQAANILAQPEGGVEYTYKPEETTQEQPKITILVNPLHWGLGQIRALTTLLILGALGIWLFPAALTRSAEGVQAKPWRALAWGFVVLVVGYAALVIAAGLIFVLGLVFAVVTFGELTATVWGIGFALLALMGNIFNLLVAHISKLVVAYALGRLILRRGSLATASQCFWALVLGIVVYQIPRSLLDIVPCVGPLVGFIVTLFGLGALWLPLYDRYLNRGGQPPAVAAPAGPGEPPAVPAAADQPGSTEPPAVS